MGLKKRFNDLEPGKKKLVVWSGIGAVFLLLIASGYHSRTQHRDNARSRTKEREIQLEPDLIQKTMLREQRRQLNTLQKSVARLLKEQKRNEEERQRDEEQETMQPLPEIPTPEELTRQAATTQGTGGTLPAPPPMNTPRNPGTAQGGGQQSQVIGEIAVLTNPSAGTAPVVDSKKKGRHVYLPPSFMEAQLLTGFDASTSGHGTSNPEPLLLRIQTPAVLPNDIKANLSGCFVVAEAVGRLDKERADVRLVSLSCLSNKGRAVIDTDIKGFVTDSDSKVGLSGRVVSRMGAATARTIVAGFFDGMGEMLKTAATTQSTSALGSTSSVKPSEVAKYSIGGGLSEGSDSLHDFYLDLAKQATPVIEVGAAKKITVIISEGKELTIKPLEGEEL